MIGCDCSLGQNVFVADRLVIGDRVPVPVKVQNNVSIDDGVTLEDEVFCGPSMVSIPVTHGFSAAMHASRTR